MSDFSTLLKEARTTYEALKNEASEVRTTDRVTVPPFPSISLSRELSKIWSDIRDNVKQDIHGYQEKKKNKQETQSIEEATEAALAESLPQEEAEVESLYLKSFKDDVELYSWFDYPDNQLENQEALKKLTECEKRLYKLFSNEYTFNVENISYLKTGVSTLNSLKKATQAISYGRISDGITILRNAKRDDTRNRSVAFCLSQLLYYRAHNGGAEYLPEAQAEASRACTPEESDQNPRTLNYRYQTLAQEIHFNPERALELSRDWYILSNENMFGQKGLFTNKGLHLKTWVLFADLDPNILDTFEIEAMAKIIKSTIAGSMFYAYFYKNKINKAYGTAPQNKFAPLIEAEADLAKAKKSYEEIHTQLIQYIDEDGSLKDSAHYPWIIEVRYLETLLQACPTPTFEEVLLHASVDGRKYNSRAYPTKAVQAAGLPNTSFWSAWILAITPSKDMHSDVTLPIARAIESTPLLRKFDILLAKLKELELGIIPEDKYQLIEAYLPPYEYRVFLDVMLNPIAFKAPEDSYYTSLHRSWSKDIPDNPLPHVSLTKRAQKAAFTSVHEIITAFEGVERVIQDRTHGLKSRAHQALKQCTKQKEKSGLAKNLLWKAHLKDYWILYLCVIPLTTIILVTINTATTYLEAIVNITIMLLIFAGLGAIFWVTKDVFKKRKK